MILSVRVDYQPYDLSIMSKICYKQVCCTECLLYLGSLGLLVLFYTNFMNALGDRAYGDHQGGTSHHGGMINPCSVTSHEVEKPIGYLYQFTSA